MTTIDAVARYNPGLHCQRFNRNQIFKLTILQGSSIAHRAHSSAYRCHIVLRRAWANTFHNRYRSRAGTHVSTWIFYRKRYRIGTEICTGKLARRGCKGQVFNRCTIIRRTVIYQRRIKDDFTRFIQRYRSIFAKRFRSLCILYRNYLYMNQCMGSCKTACNQHIISTIRDRPGAGNRVIVVAAVGRIRILRAYFVKGHCQCARSRAVVVHIRIRQGQASAAGAWNTVRRNRITFHRHITWHQDIRIEFRFLRVDHHHLERADRYVSIAIIRRVGNRLRRWRTSNWNHSTGNWSACLCNRYKRRTFVRGNRDRPVQFTAALIRIVADHHHAQGSGRSADRAVVKYRRRYIVHRQRKGFRDRALAQNCRYRNRHRAFSRCYKCRDGSIRTRYGTAI